MNPRCCLCVGDAVGVCLECDQPVCGIHEALAEHDCASACGTWQERVDNITRQRDEARAERDEALKEWDALAAAAREERDRHLRAAALHNIKADWRTRAEAAEAERDRLRAALHGIAYDPHSTYPDPRPGENRIERQYEIGVVDGHRCAGQRARDALAGSAPAPTPEIGKAVTCKICGLTKKPRGRDSRSNSLCDHECPGYAQEPHAGDLWPNESREEYGYGSPAAPRDNETAPPGRAVKLGEAACDARSALSPIAGGGNVLLSATARCIYQPGHAGAHSWEPETAPPPSGDPEATMAAAEARVAARSRRGYEEHQETVELSILDSPASAGDQPGEAADRTASDVARRTSEASASSTHSEHTATASAPPPSEPGPGASHDWYFDNGDIYCKRCSANHGELVNRPCSPPRAAVPEEPRAPGLPKLTADEAAAAVASVPQKKCTCGGGYIVGGVRAPEDFSSGPRAVHFAGCPLAPVLEFAIDLRPAAAPKVENPLARLAALEEVARAARYFSGLDFAPFLELYRALLAALANLDAAARLKETP